jgi:hypothetical protein
MKSNCFLLMPEIPGRREHYLEFDVCRHLSSCHGYGTVNRGAVCRVDLFSIMKREDKPNVFDSFMVPGYCGNYSAAIVNIIDCKKTVV